MHKFTYENRYFISVQKYKKYSFSDIWSIAAITAGEDIDSLVVKKVTEDMIKNWGDEYKLPFTSRLDYYYVISLKEKQETES